MSPHTRCWQAYTQDKTYKLPSSPARLKLPSQACGESLIKYMEDSSLHVQCIIRGVFIFRYCRTCVGLSYTKHTHSSFRTFVGLLVIRAGTPSSTLDDKYIPRRVAGRCILFPHARNVPAMKLSFGTFRVLQTRRNSRCIRCCSLIIIFWLGRMASRTSAVSTPYKQPPFSNTRRATADRFHFTHTHPHPLESFRTSRLQ